MQKRISIWLKLLTIVIAVSLTAFTAVCTCFIVSVRGAAYFRSPASDFYAGLLWYTCILCLLILYRFRKICTEIGRDNSFSLENAAGFRRMSLYAFLAFAGYPAGVIFAAATGSVTHALLFLSAVAALISLSFCIVCGCLAALVRNAWEIKHENDLTI